MHFCQNCDNMYYLKINSETDSNKLLYYCRNCGHEDETLTKNNICVSKTIIHREQQKYTTVINQYTKYDPTLPRSNNIKCPNQSCPSITGKDIPSDVLFFRYNETDMKYIYMCTICDTTWTTTNTE